MELAKCVEEVKREFPLEQIKQILAKFKSTKVLVIGETIIDEYNFTFPKGRASKDPILSVDFVRSEVYAGGILAIASHISNFVDKVTCVTIIGDREDKKDFILSTLNKNVVPKLFVKEDSPTIIKKRYLDIVRNEKLFKVENINDQPISEELEKDIMDFLESQLPAHELVIVGDFGHGLITDKIGRLLEEKSNYLAINVQCNSANLGFNYITKFEQASFATMDVPELRYAVGDRFSDVPTLMKKLHTKTNFKKFLVTLGKDGSGYFNNGKQVFFPSFVMRPLDTVGAGDTVFAITSLFAYHNLDKLIPFIANCTGGIAVSYMGNKEFITKKNLFDFIEQVYNGDRGVH